MRFEATIPDNRGSAVVQLADELGLSRSQLIDEASLALFLKVVIEVRRGRRLVTVDPSSSQPACELARPTLSALEWALEPEKITLPAEAIAKMQERTEAAPETVSGFDHGTTGRWLVYAPLRPQRGEVTTTGARWRGFSSRARMDRTDVEHERDPRHRLHVGAASRKRGADREVQRKW
jgi:hypothetical protein